MQYYKRLIRAQQPVNVQSQQKKTVSGRRGDQEEQGVAQGVRLWDGYSLKHSDHQLWRLSGLGEHDGALSVEHNAS